MLPVYAGLRRSVELRIDEWPYTRRYRGTTIRLYEEDGLALVDLKLDEEYRGSTDITVPWRDVSEAE